jgi:hypothetical protein
VKFFFKQIGATLGVANIFRYVPARLNLESNSAALKGGAQAENTLAVRVVEAFRDANQGGQASRDALFIVVEGGIGGMMPVWF